MTAKVLVCFIVNFFLVIHNSYGAQASNTRKVVKVGVIVDFDSRIGREQRAAMEIATQSFNNNESNKNELALIFQNSRGQVLTAASSAKQMIQDNNTQAIIMDSWQEASLVANIRNETRVPIISLAAPNLMPLKTQLRWPFLVTFSPDSSDEIGCIADLACAYKWRRVVVIYEDDDFGDEFGALSLLNEALQRIDSEIQHRLVLPPYSSLSDPKGFVLNELSKLLSMQSRVFIVLRSSAPMISHLFEEAKKLGFLESDSAWIITESVTSLLDSVDDSVLDLMNGTLGIKTYYSKTSTYFKDFNKAFKIEEQGNSSPGIYALRAHDSIQAITQAIERNAGENSTKVLLKNILSADFNGLSGKVSFNEGKLSQSPILRIVNVVGPEKREVSYWMPEYGFLKRLEIENDKIGKSSCVNKSSLLGSIVWPGNLNSRAPKGWAVPTIKTPLRIGVPGKTQFRKFVTVSEALNHSNSGYDGFSIRIFKMARELLNYDLPFQFCSFNGTYEELVEAVSNKTYDAAVGDITILEERSQKVQFTQPYLESRFSMIIPIKYSDSGWKFMKPFSWDVWVVTLAILVYTMVIVWFLEHQTNPEFSGTVKNQIGTTLWFTFSSLFFAQKERIHSNITRVAVTIWLCLVFILTASYTANLSSMLTVGNIDHDVTIEWLKSTNQKVGCDGDSFIKTYLENVFGFKQENILTVRDEYAYVDWFKAKNITAAFLEQPYEKVFLNSNCKKFTSTAKTYKFGGLGFAFQKGSPIARDISEAILKLSEAGKITALEKECLTPNECSQNNLTNTKIESLSFMSFYGIYLISATISTICFVIALIRLIKKYQRHQQQQQQRNNGDQSVRNKAIELVKYFYNGEAMYSPGKASTSNTSTSVFDSDITNLDDQSSSESESHVTENDDVEISPQIEIEFQEQTR